MEDKQSIQFQLPQQTNRQLATERKEAKARNLCYSILEKPSFVLKSSKAAPENEEKFILPSLTTGIRLCHYLFCSLTTLGCHKIKILGANNGLLFDSTHHLVVERLYNSSALRVKAAVIHFAASCPPSSPSWVGFSCNSPNLPQRLRRQGDNKINHRQTL